MAKKIKAVKVAKRETTFILKLTDREKERIRMMAIANGMTMSAYARFVLLYGIRKEPEND